MNRALISTLRSIHTMLVRLHLRLHLRQIATLCLSDVASNAKNGFYIYCVKLQTKTHSVNEPLRFHIMKFNQTSIVNF